MAFFEVKNNVCKFIKRVNLSSDEEEQIFKPEWFNLKMLYKTAGGPLDHCSLVCNGDFFLLSWPEKTYIFDLKKVVKVHSDALEDRTDRAARERGNDWECDKHY